MTAILISLEGENIGAWNILIEHGANLTDTTFERQNILHIAVKNDQNDFIDDLMASHRDLTESLARDRDVRGETPLMLAVQMGNSYVVRVLSGWTETAAVARAG